MDYQIPLSPYAQVFYNEWKIRPSRSDYNIVFDQILEGTLNKDQLNNAVKRFILDHVLFDSHVKENMEQSYWVKNEIIFGVDCFNKAKKTDIASYVQKPFNLNAGPLYRFCLIQRNETQYRFIIVLHHLLIDGLSMDTFCNELSNYYNSCFYKAAISRKEQLFRLSDIFKTLTGKLSKIRNEAKSFWNERLLGLEPVNLHFLEINEKRHYKVSECQFGFGLVTFSKLKFLNDRYAISPYLFAQSIFALLLHRMTKQNKFCISYPIAIKEGRSIIYGAQINMNIIPYDFDQIKYFQDLIRVTKKHIESLKAQEKSYSYLPIFETLSGFSRQLISCCFAQTSLKNEKFKFKGLKAKVCKDFNIDLPVDLLLEFEIKSNRVGFRVKYQSGKVNDYFLAEAISLYQRIFKEILNDFLKKGSENFPKAIHDYSWLSREQFNQTINFWNQTRVPFPQEYTIHKLFELQVRRTPHNIVLNYEGRTLTYYELNEKANQFASYLRKDCKVRPGSLVALCLERSEHILIILFAILKAGGAYVPIEPNYPVERINYILEDVKAKILILNKVNVEIVSDLKQEIKALIIDSDCFDQLLSSYSKLDLEDSVKSKDLAYVIYTSGTTGDPKGVMLEHSGIVNRIIWMNNQYSLSESDRVLQKTPYTFDVSVWELFWATWYGASIVFAKPDGHKDVDYLIELINKEQISIIHFVPSMLSIFTEKLEENLLTLRYIFCSGESLTLAQVKSCQRVLPGAKIHNLYGPTEASVDALYYDCSKKNIKAVYIGKPINNVKCYVLNEQLMPQPIGVIGELYIGGVGLARGYLNKKVLTDEKFIKNPFQTAKEKKQNKDERLYKTGDLARWLPDGNIEYLGRNDFQVKIRGNRVELGEVEAVLSCYPGVKQCVVLIKKRKNVSTSNRVSEFLVGFYSSEENLDEQNIYEYLQSRLPEYMLPSMFMKLKGFPLTVNGKLDRQTLDGLKLNDSANKYTAPKTSAEKVFQKLWANSLMLPLNQVGIDSDFFQLGGDSILAIRLVGMLSKQFNCNLKTQDLYEARTIRKLIQLVPKGRYFLQKRKSNYKSFSLVQKTDYLEMFPDTKVLEDIYPPSYLQAGMLIEASLDQKGTYHDVFVYPIKAKYEEDSFKLIWKMLIERNELLRASCFLNKEGYCIAIHKNAVVDIHIYRGQSTKELVLVERLNRFDYRKPGLFRLLVNEHDEKTFDLIFSFHHAIADGWSVASLIQQFIEAYVNRISLLPMANIHYGEFVSNELLAIHNNEIISFWSKYLQNSEMSKIKWIEKKEKSHSKSSLYDVSFNLSEQQTKLVHEFINKAGVSVDSIFLLAYVKTLSCYLNNSEVMLGLVVNNRLEKEGGEEAFGLFLNTIPFRFKCSKQEGIHEQLKKIFEHKIDLHNYKQLPYAYIKRCWGQETYDFSFNFVHFHVLNDSLDQLDAFVGYERTGIPFTLNVFQKWKTDICVKISAHDDYINKVLLEKFLNKYITLVEDILSGK